MKKVLIRLAVFVTVFTLVLSFFGGIGVAYVKKNIDFELDEALFQRAKEDHTVYYYAYNEEGDLSEVYKSSRDTVREWVDFDEISNAFKLGFLAMEDREFYNHHGVNIRRTIAAMANHIFKFKSTFGASTITQQVIKNISGDNEASISRKIKEIFRALTLESNHTKDDIFELYLNVVPMTGNIYGICAASEIYFGKEASEVSLAEAATIVGITNAPAKYNPYTKPEACIEKRNRVLFAMHDVGYIGDEAYEKALSEPLALNGEKRNFGISSWFIETANEDIIADMSYKYDMSHSAARLMLNGAKIILTMHPEIQKTLENYFSDTSNLSAKFNDGLNYSMVVSDPYSGNLLALVGNGGVKQGERLYNFATASITPGSVLKPLALYAPLIDEGKITWSTMLDDSPTEYVKQGDDEVPYPRNSPDVYDGYIDVNEALKRSKNTVAVRLYNMLGAKRIFDHLKNDYGFATLTERGVGVNGTAVSDLGSAPLALGQLSYGVSLRALTEAYNVFSNEGVISKGRSYTRVYDRDGKAILENKESRKRLYSTDTAQLMTQLLSSVVTDGTARQIRLKEIVDVAGKTGTSGNDRDRLFVGYTPYLTAGIWCGYGGSDTPVGQNDPSHLKIWDEVMTLIHEKTVFKGYDENIRAFSTDKLLIAPYCSKSGYTPSEFCELNDDSHVKLGYFKCSDLENRECEYCKEYLQDATPVI